MPEKGVNSYQNIPLARQESGSKKRGHPNVDVLRKAKRKFKKSMTNFSLQRPDPPPPFNYLSNAFRTPPIIEC